MPGTTAPSPMRARFGLEVLSGTLDVQNSIITTTVSNANISIQPATGGKIILGGLTFPTTVGTNHYGLISDGSGNLSWAKMVSDLSAFTTDDLPQGLDSDRKYFSDSLFGTSLALRTTDNLTQGTLHLYWAQSLFDTAFGNKTTNNLAEGTTNYYWTGTRFDTAFGNKTTTNLAEGTNLYWTPTRFSTAISGITSDNIAEGSTNKYFNDTYFATSFAKQNLTGLKDVSVTSPANNDGLVYNGTDSKWENKSLGSAAFLNAGTSANNLVQLNSSGLLPDSVLPPLAISDVYVVADDTARNALTVQKGDVAKVTADGKTYIYDGTTWQEIVAYNLVKSVNTLTGDVVLTGHNITSTFSPINYTASDTTLDSHFSGINTALAQKALSNLSDVVITSPAATQYLSYKNGKWRNVPQPVEDVTIRYVNASTGNTAANGADGSINYPYSTITEALSNGATKIHISAGTYTENVSISSGRIKIDAASYPHCYPHSINDCSVVISGKFSVSGGSVTLSNVALENTGTGGTDYALYISGGTDVHTFENVYITRPGNQTLTSVEIDGSTYASGQVNVYMKSCNIDGTLKMAAWTEVTVSGNDSPNTIMIVDTNHGILNVLDCNKTSFINHANGILNIDGIRNMVPSDEGYCIYSTASAASTNSLSIKNVNTYQSGTQGTVNKTGDCAWDAGIFTRNVGNDTFVGSRSGKFILHADDVASDLASGTDITHYTPYSSGVDLNSHLKGIDAALGTIDSSISGLLPNTAFSYAGDIIIGSGNHTYVTLQRGTNHQILTSTTNGISWQDPSSTFTDPMTSRGDLMYRDTTGLSGVTTRLPIGTTKYVLTVIDHDSGSIGWAVPHVLGDETSPTLGGDLNVFDGVTLHKITTTQTNGNVVIQANGTGHIVLGSSKFPNADGSAGYVLITNGSGTLYYAPMIASVNGLSTTSITLDGSNVYGTYTPSNFSVANKKLDTYIASIDSALGSFSGSHIIVPTATNWTATSSPPTLNDTITAIDGEFTTVLSAQSDMETAIQNMQVMTHKGDMIYSPNAFGNFARLAIGTANQILQVASGIPSWQTHNWIENPFTTDGDILMQISGQPARFGAGDSNDGKVLQVVSGLPSWQSHSWIEDPTTATGDMLVRNSSGAIDKLPSGGAPNAGYVLTVVSGMPTWQDVPNKWPGTTDGDMAYHLSGVITRLAVGTTNQILKVVGGIPTWSNEYPMTTAGDILYQASNGPAKLGIGTSGQVLTVVSGVPSWANGGFNSPMTTSGDILYQGSNGPARLGIGTSGQVLSVTSGVPAWTDGGFNSPMTTTGDMIYQASNGSARLAAGSAGQILTMISGVPSWAAAPATGVSSVNTYTGAVVLNGSNITTAHTPVAYTAADNKIDTHITGIDTALSTLTAAVPTFMKESFTISTNDIYNGYINLSNSVINSSCIVILSGLVHTVNVDYALSVVNNVSRITFYGDIANNLKTGDKIYVMYAYGTNPSNNNNNNNSQAVAINNNSTYSMSTTNQVIIQKATVNSTVTLVDSSTISAGKMVTIKDGSGISNSHPITISGNGSDTIDGQSSIAINIAYEAVTLVWNGAEWNII